MSNYSLRRGVAWLGLGLALAGCSSTSQPASPAHVGILIGAQGTASGDLRLVYDWAMESIEKIGGAGGRHLEAKYFVLDDATLQSSAAQKTLADQMLSDPDLVAVVGQFSFDMAPQFVAAGVPYITPETGDADVFRAFSGGGLVWRTLESDSTLLWFLLAEAKSQGEAAQKTKTTVGMLTGTDPYGSTFFDWYGFHAAELGLTAYPPVQYDQLTETCETAVTKLLARGIPDFVIAVPSGLDPVAQATCMVRTMNAQHASSKLLFADSVHVPELITALGADGEGLTGYDDAPDSASGFADAFTKRTNLPAPSHGANAFDAIALLAYGLEQSHGEGKKALDTGMRAVVNGTGQMTRWDGPGIQEALGLIRQGQHPDIAGASGSLRFDKDVYTDPVTSFFERWTIEGAAFKTTENLTTDTSGNTTATSQSAIASALKVTKRDTLDNTGGSPDLPARHENWALIAATSATWSNYRHQADALAQYQALRANGFDDEHIVLVMEDDLVDAAENARKGVVINTADGPNVHVGTSTDYKGKSLNSAQLMTILAGGSDASLPAVLHSKADDNVYVFLVGHGGVEGAYVGMDERALENIEEDHFVSPKQFAKTIADMHQNHQFRRMLIAVDACHSGVLGPALESLAIPDVILLTAAADTETSFSANYSSPLKSWTADQFSYALVKLVAQKSPTSIDDLYAHVYDNVAGSHPQIFNDAYFGDAKQITLDEFVVPRSP